MTIDLKERNAPGGMAGEDPDTSIKIYLREIGKTPSPMNLMSCLSESGVLVSYGGVSRKRIS
jgi:hypothetical protein